MLLLDLGASYAARAADARAAETNPWTDEITTPIPHQTIDEVAREWRARQSAEDRR